MSKQKIILTRGIPASGKTTWAEQFIKENPEFVNINRDDLRYMLFGKDYKFTRERERFVTAAQSNSALAAVDNGKSIIISDTNLNPKTIARWQEFAERRGIEFEIKDFHIELKEALRRNELRENGIPARVIKRMFFKHRAQADGEQHAVAKNEDNLPKAAIFDVDGTLARMNGRSPYDYTKVKEDLLNDDIKELLNVLKAQGYYIIVMTGRDGVCREETLEWLEEYQISYDLFLQRAEHDGRPDYVIKEELYKRHVADNFYVRYAFDDRDQVVDLWRSMGIRTLQVNYGDF